MSTQAETPANRPATPPRTSKKSWWRWWHSAALLGALGFGAWELQHRLRGEEPHKTASEPSKGKPSAPKVDVVLPKAGGIERKTVQPGSVHSFESVELYAMVTGYLKTQQVDIGSRVTKGQVLAQIEAPREVAAVDEAKALLDQAKVQARQAEAKVKTMEADRDTAAATVAQAEADISRIAAKLRLAEAQYNRVNALFTRQAVDKRLVDEQRHDFDAAEAGERSAHLAVLTAKAQLAGANAKVEQARVDVDEAKAAVEVTEARLEKARVNLNYAQILAPFDGVVTHRSYHPGAFIRSAADGNHPALLTVARTDLMRIVIRVPDRDVVLTDPGDPVTLTVDGLEGRSFEGKVSRIASSEDSTTRTMRVEVDLPNPDGLLREGMYGRATIGLTPPSKRLTLPVACVVERPEKKQGVIQVVREGKVSRVKVELGADNGNLVEVASELNAKDEVVLRSNAPLEAGMDVVIQSTQ